LVYLDILFRTSVSGTYDFCFDLDQFSIVLVLAHFSIFIHSSDLNLHSYSSFYLEFCYCFPLRSILFVSMIDCSWFCFGSVLAFDLLHYFTWKLFRRFRIVILFWFRLTFSLSFAFGYVWFVFVFLVFDSSFVHLVSVFVFTSVFASILTSIFYYGFNWFRFLINSVWFDFEFHFGLGLLFGMKSLFFSV